MSFLLEMPGDRDRSGVRAVRAELAAEDDDPFAVAFESGQFQSWHALQLDDRHSFDSRPDADPGHGYLPLWKPGTAFTEVLMFAKRVQAAVAPAESRQVTLRLIGAKGWELVPGDRRRQFFYDDHRLQTSTWERTVQLPAGGGPNSGRELAVAPSVHLLRRFGWAGLASKS